VICAVRRLVQLRLEMEIPLFAPRSSHITDAPYKTDVIRFRRYYFFIPIARHEVHRGTLFNAEIRTV